jgi:hypothetical protein
MSNEATFPISVDKTAETDVGSVLAVPRRSEGDVSEFGRPRGSALLVVHPLATPSDQH